MLALGNSPTWRVKRDKHVLDSNEIKEILQEKKRI
jgi:hypothetical protein